MLGSKCFHDWFYRYATAVGSDEPSTKLDDGRRNDGIVEERHCMLCGRRETREYTLWTLEQKRIPRWRPIKNDYANAWQLGRYDGTELSVPLDAGFGFSIDGTVVRVGELMVPGRRAWERGHRARMSSSGPILAWFGHAIPSAPASFTVAAGQHAMVITSTWPDAGWSCAISVVQAPSLGTPKRGDPQSCTLVVVDARTGKVLHIRSEPIPDDVANTICDAIDTQRRNAGAYSESAYFGEADWILDALARGGPTYH